MHRSELGWTEELQQELVCTAPELGLIPARVVRVDRGEVDLLLPDDVAESVPHPLLGIPEASAPRRAVLAADIQRRALGEPSAAVCVGDWVLVRRSAASVSELRVCSVLRRRGAVVRAAVAPGSSAGQVLAAHVDVALIVESLRPEPDLGRIERFLALVWQSGIQPLVVLTKADLVSDEIDMVQDVDACVPGARVVAVSAVTGEGLGEVAARVGPGRTAALLGPSGAGKSTLVNALVGAELMATRGLRVDGKGRHTTAHRELLVLPGGGLVIDTPGLRSVGLLEAQRGLKQVFDDIEALAGDCRFSDCTHLVEPGCAVLAAVAHGELPARRLASYRKLGREAAWMARRGDARLAAQENARWKKVHQEVRASGRIRRGPAAPGREDRR